MGYQGSKLRYVINLSFILNCACSAAQEDVSVVRERQLPVHTRTSKEHNLSRARNSSNMLLSNSSTGILTRESSGPSQRGRFQLGMAQHGVLGGAQAQTGSAAVEPANLPVATAMAAVLASCIEYETKQV